MKIRSRGVDLPLPILTPRLVIRSPKAGDGEALAAAVKETWNDLYPWFHQHLGAWHDETDPRWKEAQIAGMNEDLTAGRRICLLGFDRSDHSLAVSTGFPNIDWVTRRFEVDYWVARSHQRKGLAQEAVNGLLRFAFSGLGAREITLAHAEGNEASATIAARLEFGRVSTVPEGYSMPDGRQVAWHTYRQTRPEGLLPIECSWD